MGAIYNSIPTKLADGLRKRFGLTMFVESGLAQGTTTLWAESLFDFVVSIEIDKAAIETFESRYPKSTVMIVEGDSSDRMIEIVQTLDFPALFWLDGHSDAYTPILEELTAINQSELPHVIMIDDWRMFGTCPAWPSKERVIEFATVVPRKVYDIDDVLVATP